MLNQSIINYYCEYQLVIHECLIGTTKGLNQIFICFNGFSIRRRRHVSLFADFSQKQQQMFILLAEAIMVANRQQMEMTRYSRWAEDGIFDTTKKRWVSNLLRKQLRKFLVPRDDNNLIRYWCFRENGDYCASGVRIGWGGAGGHWSYKFFLWIM